MAFYLVVSKIIATFANRKKQQYKPFSALPHHGKRNDMTTIEQELMKTGYRYSDNEDGTFDVCYDHNQDAFFSPLNGYHVATVKEDDELWYVDNNCGAGWGEYPKADWTLERAIYDQCIDEYIN